MKIDRIDVMPIGGDAMSPAAGLLVRVGTASGLVGLGEVATDDASPATSRTTVSVPDPDPVSVSFGRDGIGRGRLL